jgi:phosphopantothenoylcysteine decarboxylase/phosphopantothenate--cysteine ligase
MLRNKKILLGVSGGIAAYKTPELVRRLKDAGADVQVILTPTATRFVSPLSLEVVSGHPVRTELWSTDGDSQIVHTDAGKSADLIIVAPATANLLARLAHGFADDLLTCAVMACSTPVVVCPSMNTDMLENPIVERNIALLDGFERFTYLYASEGQLACGVHGAGRLPDPPTIIEAAYGVLSPKVFSGLRATISAGPTQESIDPVRYLTNHATGTMGFALARVMAARGAEVTLVSGPTDLFSPQAGISRIDVVSAADMAAAIDRLWPTTDILVMAAAVADYRPRDASPIKLKKSAEELGDLPLERTKDVLLSTKDLPGRSEKVVVGFAAETENVALHAEEKLKRKELDAIIANEVGREGSGFGRGDNAGMVFQRNGQPVLIERCDKHTFACQVIDALTPIFTSGRASSEKPLGD